MMRLGPIRLLPLTIAAMACLLGVKSVQLVSAAAATGASETSAVVPAKAVATAPAPPDTVKPPDDATPPISDGERSVLLELRKRRQELDAREATVADRESMLTAAEQKISARVGELQALQQKLEALEATRKAREDAGWQGLVKVYESMKPRDAATIFNELEMPVLLQVVDRMKEAKAAPVLAAMQPDKARDLTAKLADMRTRRDNPAGG
jgi:flagellar motility protein MotE (MotC chaperone)